MKKKEILIFLILIIGVIGIILLINSTRENGDYDKETMLCIAKDTKLIVSPTCGYCAQQKDLLKENLDNYEDYFEILTINPELSDQYNLKGVPTWIINEQTYSGLRTIEQLKELTGC